VKFGQRLRELRLKDNLSQDSLSEQIELLFGVRIPREAISRLENGSRQPTLDHLKIFAQFFDVSLDFMSGEGTLGLDTDFDEVMEIRESMRNSPEMKLLFSLSKNAPPGDVQEAARLLQLLKETRYADDT